MNANDRSNTRAASGIVIGERGEAGDGVGVEDLLGGAEFGNVSGTQIENTTMIAIQT